jgi:hypothetical protein
MVRHPSSLSHEIAEKAIALDEAVGVHEDA